MRVPTVREGSVQVAGLPDAQQRMQTTSAEFGGLAAEGMIQAGQQVQAAGGKLADYAVRMAEEDARTEAEEAELRWSETRRTALFDGDSAYYRLQGKDAYQGMKGAADRLTAAMKEQEQSLSPMAQTLFRRRRMPELNADLDRMSVHAAGERTRWQDATADATVQNYFNEAALETDPTLREEAMNRALDARIARAQEKGISLDDPVLQEQIATDRSTAALLALKTDMARNPQAARRYFETVKGALSPLALAQATDMMDAQRRKEEADQRARVAELRMDSQYALQALNAGIPFAGYENVLRRAEATDPETAQRLRLAAGNVEYAAGLRKLDLAGLEQEASRAEQQARSATDPQVAANLASRIGIAQGIYREVQANLRADPLGWAESQHLVEPTGILQAFGKAAGLGDDAERGRFLAPQVQRRMAAIEATKARYGVEVDFFRPGEAALYAKALEQAETPDEKLALLTPLRSLAPSVARGAVAQLGKAGVPETALRALDRIDGDPAGMAPARRILAEMIAPKPDLNLAEADLKTVRSNTTEAYRRGIGGVLQKAYAVTGDARYQERAQTDEQALLRSAEARAGMGRPDAVTTAYDDHFGNRSAFSVDGLAHVIVPAGANRARLEQGFLAIRQQETPALLSRERPADPDLARMWEGSTLRAVQQGGTFVPLGTGFALIHPGSGQPVAGPDGRTMRWSVEDVLAAADRAAPAPGRSPAAPWLLPWPLLDGGL